MKTAPRLELRTSQSLVMTQQLQQSIKLLQLSSLELQEYLNQELEKNPLLTTEDGQDSVAGQSDSGSDESGAGDTVGGEDGETGEGAEREVERDDSDWNDETFAGNDSDDSAYGEREPERIYSGVRNHNYDGDDFAPEHHMTREKSLRDHLQEQLAVAALDPVERLIGMNLIDMLDEAGYVTDDLAQLGERLACNPEQVQNTLAVMQQFDPPGIFARNLAECLAIQLKEKDRYDPAMEQMITHLNLLGAGDMVSLKKICGVDDDDLRQMIAEIRELNPKPAQGFAHDAVQTVVPDIFLKKTKGDGWHIELNNQVLPRVLVNQQYYVRLQGSTRNKQEKKYLTDQLSSAHWLVKAMDQRAQTILKVTAEMVKQQDAFFRHGVHYLKPMTLKDVAAVTELHESTVSRVTTNKFLSTPRGMFELKYFFTSTIQNTTGGGDYSSRAVQQLIKDLVDGESAGDILSDDTISEKLKQQGVNVARRTVTKYREAMHIGSSVQRRRDKTRDAKFGQ